MGASRPFRTAFVALIIAAVSSACSVESPQPPRVVDITTGDNIHLKGTFFAAAKPGPAVLLLHQCDDQRRVWDSLGVRLATAGVNAMSVDYRGYGESGGTEHDKLASGELQQQINNVWPADIDSAYAFLLRQPGVQVTQMGAAGGSCGVNNAVQLARRHKEVKALALLAGPMDRAARQFLEAPNGLPVFTAAAADDKYANFVEIMSWIFGVSHNPASRFAQYKDGGHAAVVFKAHPELADDITRWFAAVLADRQGTLPATNGVPMKPAVVKTLHDLDQPGGAAVVGAQLEAARKLDARAELVPEYITNQLGYEHMLMKDYPTAIEIMKLEVAAYPESPNAMDSLGDVYLAAGDRKLALQSAKQTLMLLEKDTKDTDQRKKDIRGSAEGKIKQLEGTTLVK